MRSSRTHCELKAYRRLAGGCLRQRESPILLTPAYLPPPSLHKILYYSRLKYGHIIVCLCLSVCLCLPVCLCLFVSVCLSVYLSVSLTVSISVGMSVCLCRYFSLPLSLYLSISLYVYLSVSVCRYLSLSLSVCVCWSLILIGWLVVGVQHPCNIQGHIWMGTDL